jgi:hypothetical protein
LIPGEHGIFDRTVADEAVFPFSGSVACGAEGFDGLTGSSSGDMPSAGTGGWEGILSPDYRMPLQIFTL